jgi:hypothetical protein
VRDFIADGDLAMPIMKIGVVGVGHVGLVAAVFAHVGHVRELAGAPTVVDGRDVLDPDAAEAADLTYLPVGRPRRTERVG